VQAPVRNPGFEAAWLKKKSGYRAKTQGSRDLFQPAVEGPKRNPGQAGGGEQMDVDPASS
jgi:hypothetical protein